MSWCGHYYIKTILSRCSGTGTFVQGIKPLNAYIVSCDELVTHSGLYPAMILTMCQYTSVVVTFCGRNDFGLH